MKFIRGNIRIALIIIVIASLIAFFLPKYLVERRFFEENVGQYYKDIALLKQMKREVNKAYMDIKRIRYENRTLMNDEMNSEFTRITIMKKKVMAQIGMSIMKREKYPPGMFKNEWKHLMIGLVKELYGYGAVQLEINKYKIKLEEYVKSNR